MPESLARHSRLVQLDGSRLRAGVPLRSLSSQFRLHRLLSQCHNRFAPYWPNTLQNRQPLQLQGQLLLSLEDRWKIDWRDVFIKILALISLHTFYIAEKAILKIFHISESYGFF